VTHCRLDCISEARLPQGSWAFVLTLWSAGIYHRFPFDQTTLIAEDVSADQNGWFGQAR
jgi:hypothetical protein